MGRGLLVGVALGLLTGSLLAASPAATQTGPAPAPAAPAPAAPTPAAPAQYPGGVGMRESAAGESARIKQVDGVSSAQRR